MTSVRFLFIIVAIGLSACASHDGSYAPGCIAFAGDTVELHGGRFEWDKFTDEMRVGPDGNVADPFPDHPVVGNYRVSGERISFMADSGSAPEDMYLLGSAGEFRMLTPAQYEEWRRTGEYPECSLVRGGGKGSRSAPQN